MSVAENLQLLRSKVQELCRSAGRSPSSVRIVAVSKTKPNEMVMQAYDADQRHFGENYVQELIGKAPDLPSDIKWHYIGHLQSNKVKKLLDSVPNLYVIESVDSVKLANTINKHVPEDRAEKLRVMVQVNTSGEDSKSGVEPTGCCELVRHVIENCTKLQFTGLMTIGRLGDVSPECFETLKQCREEILALQDLKLDAEAMEMSMGMSADYPLAIEQGSTSIRIGSTIFGARDYSKSGNDNSTSALDNPNTGPSSNNPNSRADS